MRRYTSTTYIYSIYIERERKEERERGRKSEERG